MSVLGRWICVIGALAWLGLNVGVLAWQPDARTDSGEHLISTYWPAAESQDQVERDAQERGFVYRLYTDESGREHRYVVFVPYERSPGEKLPLILYLNGAGKSGEDGLAPLKDGLAPAIWESQAHFPFVVLFVQSHERSWPAEGGDAQRALAILENAEREYQTDPDRVYLTGLSSGGSGVWDIAGKHPHRFAAIAPMSPMGCDESLAKVFAESHLPIWSFYVAGDETQLVESNKKWRRALIDAGASPQFTEVVGFGHNSWDYAYDQPAFYAWLLEQERSANARQQEPFVPLFNRRDLDGLQPHGAGAWSVDDVGNLLVNNTTVVVSEEEGVGSSVDEPSMKIGNLMTDATYRDFELHLEFWLESATGCDILLRATCDDDRVSGWKLNVRRSESGSGGLFEPNGECIADDEPVAQRALISDGWNDLRMLVAGNHVIVRLNGWTTLDVNDERLNPVSVQSDSEYRLAPKPAFDGAICGFAG